jgi:hypothetical protein
MSQFTQTHHAQNPINIEVLNFVHQRGHATWQELFNAFGEGEASSNSVVQRFGKKLEYLVYTDKLQATGRGRARTFYIGLMAGKPPCGRGRTDVHPRYTDPAMGGRSPGNGGQITARAAGVCSDPHYTLTPITADPHYAPEPTYTPVTLTPPRQTNTMAADPYVPPTQTAMRAGSLDYQRYASFGDRC